ncbi:SMC-Scp complex subunit ScpB [Candidatus Woesearchaeota archaeon]|nr:SMC-Scp complex subunit ScpB [Candidatus Woesearchaeota archaeon]
MTPLTQQLEAILFVTGDPMSEAEATRLLKCSGPELADAIAELREHLADTGVALVTTDGQLQLTTASNVATIISSLHVDADSELSTTAAETLALVAYRGPVTRSEVDAIRGVDSSRALRQLALRGLVERTRVGSHYTYQATVGFLRQMGLTHLSELPEYKTLSSPEALQELLDT